MTSPLSREARVVIEQACTRLVLTAADATDRQDYAGLVTLFTPDGKLFRPTAPDAPLEGREAIEASYQARPAQRITRHFCSNIRVQVETAERARVSTYVQVFAADTQSEPDGHFGWPLAGRTMIGEFDDLCVLDQGAWRFAERHAQFVMHRDG
ncbi:nuclear transport factor 2 family protein [Chromohalobacter nigrandesensis]|uniref:nuclear transport factor 2 family protein n=1 Tax=Chromohalobacter nigrandesensis TaxID=119863 RepID=UPI001FF4153E|nr:nuclear transport factor 2 family protein [Chromohalobacter nigrandesensis]MCK0745179.1 nuclear transport factor 2 family protein [Chromohalobacter nigrandesensis]